MPLPPYPFPHRVPGRDLKRPYEKIHDNTAGAVHERPARDNRIIQRDLRRIRADVRFRRRFLFLGIFHRDGEPSKTGGEDSPRRGEMSAQPTERGVESPAPTFI